MFARFSTVGILAALALVVAAGPAEAFGRRSAACSHTPVYDPCYCPPYYPCGPVYVVSPPPVPLHGPYPTLLRVVKFGNGIIVQVDDHSGTPHQPTGLIQVITTGGPGEVRYEGYNKHYLTPGVPGGTIRYSIFLLPTKPGKVDIKVGFVLDNNTIVNVPFAFDITP